MKKIFYCVLLAVLSASAATEFTGPASWKLINTNAVEKWQADCKKLAGDDFLSLKGVVADRKKMEVRLLAEAVGHDTGTTTEFMLVGPHSDRAYESVGVTVSSPSDIVRAVEFLGIKRGSCIDAGNFKFVACGERFRLFVRRLDGGDSKEVAFASYLKESMPDDPLYPQDGFVFAGGVWEQKDGESRCLTDTVPPCSVISLYNELSIFDMPQQAGQSAVYGRLSVKEALPYGALLEIIARPVSKESTVLPVSISVQPSGEGFALHIQCEKLKVSLKESVKESVDWLKSQSDAGKDLFVTLKFDEDLNVGQAHDVAALFEILSGGGVKLYGKESDGVYYKAFLPQESWREREGRTPQPFEVHVSRDENGALIKKLVFIEEDWNVKGLDPKITPREYPFEKWSDLEPLVIKAGGEDNKVAVLFFFVPGDMKIGEFMPGVNALSKRLPLVHIFTEK